MTLLPRCLVALILLAPAAIATAQTLPGLTALALSGTSRFTLAQASPTSRCHRIQQLAAYRRLWQRRPQPQRA